MRHHIVPIGTVLIGTLPSKQKPTQHKATRRNATRRMNALHQCEGTKVSAMSDLLQSQILTVESFKDGSSIS